MNNKSKLVIPLESGRDLVTYGYFIAELSIKEKVYKIFESDSKSFYLLIYDNCGLYLFSTVFGKELDAQDCYSFFGDSQEIRTFLEKINLRENKDDGS